MKKLLGGLLLVSAISSWGLQAAQNKQAAQDATEQCFFEDPVTVSFKRMNNDGQEEFFSETYVFERFVLEKSPMIRAMLHYDHQPLAGNTLPEDLLAPACQELSLSLVTGTPAIFYALFTVLAGNEDVSIKDWDSCLIGWPIKDVIEAYALIDYFFPLTDYGNIQEARYVLGEKILAYTYNLSSEQQQIYFIYNEIIPAIGSFEQLLYACIKYVMTPVEGVIKDTKYLKEQLGLPVDQPLFLLISSIGVKKEAKGLQLLVEEPILKKVVIPDYLQGNVLLKVIQNIMLSYDRQESQNNVDTLEKEEAQRSFVEAIKNNNIALVKVLLAIYGRVLVDAVEPAKFEQINSRVRVVNQNRSVLFLAIDLDHKEIVRLLLQAGADKDEYLEELLYQSTERSSIILPGTPLSYAVWKGRTDIVKMLIDAGADLSLGNLLFIAMDKKRNNIVKMLLDAGVPMHLNALDQAVTTNNEEALKMLLDHGTNVNIQDRDGGTPLMRAVAMDNQNFVNILLDYNADVNIQMDFGITSLMAAVMRENREIVQRLLQVPEIDLSLQATIGDDFTGTVLEYAQRYVEYKDSLELLLAYLRNRLIEAVSADVLDFDKIQELLEQGADIYAVNDSGVSAFSLAENLHNQDLDRVLAPYKKLESMVSRLKKWWQGK